MDYVTGFFTAIDHELDRNVQHLRQRLFSTYRDLPWTDEQRQTLAPLLRAELEYVVTRLLALFDNIGGDRVPDEVLGYTIMVLPDTDAGAESDSSAVPLLANSQDYADAWRDFLSKRYQHIQAE
jgi:hypothetical protein